MWWRAGCSLRPRGGGYNAWFSPPPPEAALSAPHSPLGLTNGSSLAPCPPDSHWVPARPLPELRWAGGEVGACPPEASLLGAVCGMVAVLCVWPRGPQLILLLPSLFQAQGGRFSCFQEPQRLPFVDGLPQCGPHLLIVPLH